MELFKVDFGLTVWMFVAFAILLFILWKYAWPAILKGVDGRADLIDKGVEYAQNAKEKLDSAHAEAQRYVAEARHQQADIIAEANKIKSQIIEEARDAVLDTLNDYPADLWGDALGAAVASLFQSKQDAADMAEEEKASREISTTETEPPEGIF